MKTGKCEIETCKRDKLNRGIYDRFSTSLYMDNGAIVPKNLIALESEMRATQCDLDSGNPTNLQRVHQKYSIPQGIRAQHNIRRRLRGGDRRDNTMECGTIPCTASYLTGIGAHQKDLHRVNSKVDDCKTDCTGAASSSNVEMFPKTNANWIDYKMPPEFN